jgi:hypothetical protein
MHSELAFWLHPGLSDESREPRAVSATPLLRMQSRLPHSQKNRQVSQRPRTTHLTITLPAESEWAPAAHAR